MIKKILCAAVLAACGATVHAETVTQWSFTWTGFSIQNVQGSLGYDPAFSVTGTFSGIDANHDNVIVGSELTELTVMGRDFVNCGPSPGTYCGITWFTYGQETGLQFRGTYEEVYFHPYWGPQEESLFVVETGNSIYYDDYEFSSSSASYTYWFWPETVQTITQISPVPEPQAYAMFGAGMLLLGAAARRRNRR